VISHQMQLVPALHLLESWPQPAPTEVRYALLMRTEPQEVRTTRRLWLLAGPVQTEEPRRRAAQ
jgi:hypothetical protein